MRTLGLLCILAAAACGVGSGEHTSFVTAGSGESTDDEDGDADSESEDENGDGDHDSGPVLDTAPPDICDDTGELVSYIWIANSIESTVSKINTVTMVEEGRFLTRPDGMGNPSRTSVSIEGDVAVANRNGGITKFYAVDDRCEDENGTPGIQTSTGGDDVLDYDVEECRAWHTPFDGYVSQRPVAWTKAEYDEDLCGFGEQFVWTAGNTQENGSTEVIRLRGDTGEIDELIPVPEVVNGTLGAYGGAVDADGNLWFTQYQEGSLVRVDFETLEYDIYPMGRRGYGMTVDSQGRPWICGNGVGYFDEDTQQVEWADAGYDQGAFCNIPGWCYGGCMIDENDVLWTSENARAPADVRGIDINTMEVVETILVPQNFHGVSIDFDGKVWGIPRTGDSAFRLDPQTQQIDEFGGLSGAYTYSDMTGFALKNAGAAG